MSRSGLFAVRLRKIRKNRVVLHIAACRRLGCPFLFSPPPASFLYRASLCYSVDGMALIFNDVWTVYRLNFNLQTVIFSA